MRRTICASGSAWPASAGAPRRPTPTSPGRPRRIAPPSSSPNSPRPGPPPSARFAPPGPSPPPPPPPPSPPPALPAWRALPPPVRPPAVIDAGLKVFAGTVNHELVATLVAHGAPAVGLTGIDANLTDCEIVKPELGQVGRPVRTHPQLLNTLCHDGFLPVVACVGGDSQGRVYNVNGDQMAASLAAGWQATKVLFLTDVEGVRGADNQRIPVLRSAHARELMASGVAAGGMLAKLRAAQEALDAGVSEVRIVSGAADHVLARVLAGEDLGTSFVS
ncbi:acetylglutamate kinase [Nostoc sp. NIES-2111]